MKDIVQLIIVLVITFTVISCSTNTVSVDSEYTGRELFWKLKAKNRSDNTGSILFRELSNTLKIRVSVEVTPFVKGDVFTAKVYKGEILSGNPEVLLDLGNVTYLEKSTGTLTIELGDTFKDNTDVNFKTLLELDGHVRILNADGLMVSGVNIGANEGSVE